MRVVIASHNPVKVEAARRGFARMFPGRQIEYLTIAAASGVSDQPRSNDETRTGAANRAAAARQSEPAADFWIGIEGGIEDEAGEMSAFAWVVILSASRSGAGRSGTFFLPDRVAQLVREGVELGEADDIVFGQRNSKQANGAVGILTSDVINRAELYEQAVILALIPHHNPQLYPYNQS